jgi:hypothetical protein
LIQAVNTDNIHKIVGDGSNGQNINNLGWTEVDIDVTGGTYTPDVGPNGMDGANTIVNPPLQKEYTDLGWDFTPGTGEWEMDVSGYPKLQWQPTPIPPPPPVPAVPLSPVGI